MGYFKIDKLIGIGSIAAIILLFLLLVIYIARFRQMKYLKRLTQEENLMLKASYQDLEETYNESITSFSELSAKFDELNKNKENMKKLAYTDYLTELPNRAAFTEMLDNIMLTLRSEEIVGIMEMNS